MENDEDGYIIASTTNVLRGTVIHIIATTNEGYNLLLKVSGSCCTSGCTKEILSYTMVESKAQDNRLPMVKITKSAYNRFNWTISDDDEVVGYQINQDYTEPTSRLDNKW